MKEGLPETMEELELFAKKHRLRAEDLAKREGAAKPGERMGAKEPPRPIGAGEIQPRPSGQPVVPLPKKPAEGKWICAGCGGEFHLPSPPSDAARLFVETNGITPRPSHCPPCYETRCRRIRAGHMAPVRDGMLHLGQRHPSEFRFGTELVADWVSDREATRQAQDLDPLRETALIVPDPEDPEDAGHGKSVLLMAIANQLMDRVVANEAMFERHRSIAFIPAILFAPADHDDLEAREKHAHAIQMAKGASVLFIDDLGQEMLGAPRGSALAAANRKAVCTIMQERFNAGRITHLSTPFSKVEIDAMYAGGGTGRRIYDHSAAGGGVRTIIVHSAQYLIGKRRTA